MCHQFKILAWIIISLPILASTGKAESQAGMKTAPVQHERQTALGKKLFFDRRLSANGTLSCALCHIPEQGFAQNQLATPVGFKGRSVKRNSPTLLNVTYRSILFFDGREFTLENQVWSPLLSTREMGNVSIGAVINRLQHLDDYAGMFKDTYNDGITAANIGAALASYERTLIAAGSPFDEWYFGEQVTAVNDDVKMGFTLFVRHGCSQCHTVKDDNSQFTDDDFHNTGIGFARSMLSQARGTKTINLAETILIQTTELDNLNDLGRYEMTGLAQDKWKYRTPTLRNVALTSPYMHDGSLSSLNDVIAFYMKGGIANDGLDARIRPFNLNKLEFRQLLLFLQSLTSPHIQELIEDARRTKIGDY